MLLGVLSYHERWDVDKLLSHTDVSVTDHHTGMVHGLGEAKLEDLGLESTLEEIFWLKIKDIVQLHVVFCEDAVSDKTTKERITFEKSTRVLLVKSKELTGSLTGLGKTVLHTPDFTFAPKSVFANNLQFLVKTLLLEWLSRSFVCLGVDLASPCNTWA